MGTWVLIETLRRLADLPLLLRWVAVAKMTARLRKLEREGNDGR